MANTESYSSQQYLDRAGTQALIKKIAEMYSEISGNTVASVSIDSEANTLNLIAADGETVLTSINMTSEDNTLNITSNSDDNTVDLSVNIDNSTIMQDSENNNVLYVVNALSDIEKSWIEDESFDTLFTVSISRDSSYYVYSGESYTVTFTLTCKYNGELMKLYSTPSGWTYSSTGTYTKEVTVSSSTGSSVSSGSVTCMYDEDSSKTASSISVTNVKYSYVVYSSDETLSEDTLTDLINNDSNTQTLNTSTSSNTIANENYTLTVPEDGDYVFFAISNTSSLSDVKQAGVSVLSTDTSVSPLSVTYTNYGTYTVYRSASAQLAGDRSVTIS